MRQTFTALAGLYGLLCVAPGARAQSTRLAPLPAPAYTITLGGRDACVTPHTRMRARADGGIIDVQTSAPDVLTVSMTGAPASDSYLGCTSTATQTFHLVQEFEVASADPSIESVSLVLDSTVVGYVRSARKAVAGMRLASATIAPVARTGYSSIELVHPPLEVSGTQGRLCNQHLAPLHGAPMPLGRFVLTADFLLDTTASGVCNAHAAADFSPDTALPAEWVRMRDPFQGVSKKSFGFSLSVSARPPSSQRSAAPTADARSGSRGDGAIATPPVNNRRSNLAGF